MRGVWGVAKSWVLTMTGLLRARSYWTSGILDEYVMSEPSDQNALDIFQGEWSSKLPSQAGELKAGQISLFEDGRILWAEKKVGGFEGCKIIELGPLEAGHTYMLEKRGANSILAIEANTRAYLKCLIVKEILNLERSRFLPGDFVKYLRNNDETFDICLASGVLYHMSDPVELIHLISKTSDKVIIWTHYYSREIIRNNPDLSNKFSEKVNHNYNGFKHTLYKYAYKEALAWAGFCGGSAPYSFWMTKEDILSCLRFFGFHNLQIGFDHPDHPQGPAFCIVGIK